MAGACPHAAIGGRKMPDHVIRIANLGKQYRIGRQSGRYATLRDTLARLLASPFGGASGASRPSDDHIWALRNVSFDVPRGAVVGIIGRNGAGKSTLLKILSRITEPTEGHVEIQGRIGSLLEVGTGFHAELTGRENVYLNGAILGLRAAEIERRFDEIVGFAEVEQFVDTPVKHYSSGMYLRLAFAVAAHLDPEILLVDEVLAVGDLEFQKKCIGKISDVARGGRTVLFVSHNMVTVQRLCSSALLLDRGQVVQLGPVDQVVDRYVSQSDGAAAGAAGFRPGSRGGTGWARVVDMRLLDEQGHAVGAVPCDADLLFEIDMELRDAVSSGASLRGLVLELSICSALGQPLLSLMNVDDSGVDLPAASSCRVQVRLRGPTFVPGRYSVNVFLGLPYLQHVDEVLDALRFDILPPRQPWRPYELHEARGVVCRKADWTRVELASV
jgi:homopolymeric O-antigen transport system ATP-binding protein